MVVEEEMEFLNRKIKGVEEYKELICFGKYNEEENTRDRE